MIVVIGAVDSSSKLFTRQAMAETTIPASAYRIGFLMQKEEIDRVAASLRLAAERLNYSIILSDEPTTLASLPLDFVVTTCTHLPRSTTCPTFAVARDP